MTDTEPQAAGSADGGRAATLKTVIEVAVAAMKSDGHASEEELARLAALCGLSPLFKEVDPRALAEGALQSDQIPTTRTQLKAAAGQLPPSLRATAFALAIEVVLADGVLSREEELFLGHLAEDLHVAEHIAQSLIMATMVRNQGWE